MDEVRFEELGLRPEIMRAVKKMGFEEASPIQAKAIPVMMSGCDLIGQAQTGTGKTAAFGIPLLEKIDPRNKKLQAIVLCPTRELAIQVAEEIRHLAWYMHGIKVLPIYGGQEIVKQIRSLKGGIQLIIGTPGRVMDHMRRKTIKMEHLHTVVLDEADEMLNMGFREDIETILEEVPKERQTVLFSATMPKPILDITKRFQDHAQMIKVTKKELTVPNIEQYYYEVTPRSGRDTGYQRTVGPVKSGEQYQLDHLPKGTYAVREYNYSGSGGFSVTVPKLVTSTRTITHTKENNPKVTHKRHRRTSHANPNHKCPNRICVRSC